MPNLLVKLSRSVRKNVSVISTVIRSVFIANEFASVVRLSTSLVRIVCVINMMLEGTTVVVTVVEGVGNTVRVVKTVVIVFEGTISTVRTTSIVWNNSRVFTVSNGFSVSIVLIVSTVRVV